MAKSSNAVIVVTTAIAIIMTKSTMRLWAPLSLAIAVDKRFHN